MRIVRGSTAECAGHAKAAGKVLLFGEYAVLSGGLAVGVGVHRAARCLYQTPEAAGLDAGALTIEGVGYGVRRGAVGAAGRATLWPDGALPFSEAVLQRTPQVRAGRYLIESAAFHEAGTKLGLGSSAASSVAFAKALDPAAVNGTIFERVQGAHRAVQGTGSGADVALSSFGGALAYRWRPEVLTLASGQIEAPQWAALEERPMLRCEVPGQGQAQIWRLSAAPVLTMAWSGQAASTPSLVAAVCAWGRTQPQALRAHLEAIAQTAWAGGEALQSPATGALLRAARAASAALEALAQASGVALFTPQLQVLAKKVAERGGCAKPTGAGGGDLMWLVGEDAEHEAVLAQVAQSAGYPVITLYTSEALPLSAD